jgi:site-specific DNA-methyltransferase (cytosine-N4-specific)
MLDTAPTSASPSASTPTASASTPTASASTPAPASASTPAPASASTPAPASAPPALADLSSIGWDFDGLPAARTAHSIHPYPAKFIPEIPRELIGLFPPPPGTAVFDPFCGSGTTLLEARLLGYPSIGNDLSPLAALIARVKTMPLAGSLGAAATEICRLALARSEPIPDIPRVDHWFQPPVQDALARLVARIDDVEDVSMRNALLVALSRIIVRVSNQDSDTRYAAVEKDVTFDEVLSRFMASARKIELALSLTFDAQADVGPAPVIFSRDVLQLSRQAIAQDVGLIVTSPPYPNVYEYWLYHKYRMYWLGMDPIAVRTAEIGARPHYFKKHPQTAADFERQMVRCFSLFGEILVAEGHVCFLVGRSIIRGERIDLAHLLRKAASKAAFRCVDTATRLVSRDRRTFNLSHSPNNEETLLVFQAA